MGSLTGGMSGVGGAPATVCVANQPACDANRATTCNPEGTGYLVVGLKCNTDQTCFEGACENHKCTPSSVFCLGQELKACAANGLSSTSQTCDVGATCTASAGLFACVCKPGYSGTGLSCAATLCGVNQRVEANACVACGAGTTNAAGDNATGVNTSCDATLCGANQYVQANACVACGAGTTNAAGDDASGVNTSCDATLCGVNQYVQANACVACGAGSTNTAGDNATGGNTTCDATLCGINQHVQANACVACGAGTTNAAGDDASGVNTSCDATLCLANQRVQANACLACGVGTTNAAGDDASGGNTSCDATLCGANQYVQANACVSCGAGSTNAAGDDASGANTSCDVPPSCQGLAANCAGESCCTSPTVTGGTFNRSNDMNSPAMVSSFRLDKYEVTVGRFRNFVTAVVGGWTPASGSGKHTHLNGGAGLANSAGGGNEPGWDTAWNGNLPTVKTAWDGSGYLGADATYQTWTPSSGGNEARPINYVNWYQSAAFCIWDGGFLPSEAEWNYAAAGGNQQRQYPWSLPASSTTIDCSYANYYRGAAGYCVAPPNGSTSVVGSVSPKGNGLYGQSDLGGNVWEWNLDWFTSYAAICNNCANSTAPSSRVIRGGSFGVGASGLLSSLRASSMPGNRSNYFGLRCARTP